MDELLDSQRERLLLEFFRLEDTIAQLQGNLDLLSSIKFIEPVQRSSN